MNRKLKKPVNSYSKLLHHFLLNAGPTVWLIATIFLLNGSLRASPADFPFSQVKEVQGKIVNDEGQPVAGATIRVVGGSNSAITDANGFFSISVTGSNAKLEVSHVSYQSREIAVGEGFMEIILNRTERAMEEVVVVGYGKQRKMDLTGAVTQVSGDVLTERPIANIGQALQGQVPNLNITTTGDPGGPWSPASFNVRGTTSINGGEPLFVVDGIPATNINTLNVNDIESITVLKDAAAGAIYGSRASYGVILVTTKSGLKTDKTELNISSISAWSTYTALPKLVNSVQYARAYNDAAANSGLALPFSDDFIARLQQYMDDPTSIPVAYPMPNNPNRWGWVDAVDNVSYFKVYLKDFSFNQKTDVSLRGGKKTLNYFISAGYYDMGGQLRYGDEKFKRLNLTSNIHAEPRKWLRLDLRTRYARENLNIPYHYSDLQGNWFHLAGSRRPYWPDINPDGDISQISGLPSIANGGRTIRRNNDLWLTGNVEIEPVKNWLITANYSYNGYYSDVSDHYAKVWFRAVDGSKIYSTAPNWFNTQSNNDDYTSLNIYSSYHQQIRKHSFKVLAGYQQEEKKLSMLNGRRQDLITDLLPAILLATGAQQAFDARNEWATIGTFGRFNYAYDDKYLLEVNARYDGTSRFPKGKQFGLFPSVAVGYNLSNEDFWPWKAQVNNFKLRASYGSLGNQSLGSLSNSFSIFMPVYNVSTGIPYLFQGSDLMTYLTVPGIVNPNLTWETVQSLNFGLDASFLSNRLELTFDWYRRNTLDMIGPAEALPLTLGAAVPRTNNADLQTKGFELSLSWRDRIGSDFRYNVSFLLSDYVTQVERYNNPTQILSTYYSGMRIGEIWGFETRGIIQDDGQLTKMPNQSFLFGRWNVGDIEYADLDGNGIINRGANTLSDPGDQKVIGNSTPRFAFGSNLGMSYKGFDLNIFLQGVLKRDLALNGTFFYGIMTGYNNISKNSLDYWTEDNKGAYWPKQYLTGEYNKNRQVQSRYLQNGAYMRLKNVQLGYTLPALLMQKFTLKHCRFFLSGENLLTFSNIIEGMDPETAAVGGWGSGKVHPLMRTISFGATITF